MFHNHTLAAFQLTREDQPMIWPNVYDTGPSSKHKWMNIQFLVGCHMGRSPNDILTATTSCQCVGTSNLLAMWWNRGSQTSKFISYLGYFMYGQGLSFLGHVGMVSRYHVKYKRLLAHKKMIKNHQLWLKIKYQLNTLRSTNNYTSLPM